jgi:hypothetical protein
MPFVLTVDVTTEGAPAPTRSVITYDLPPHSTDADAITVARGIRTGFRNAFSARVQVIGLQQTGMSRDLDLGV